MVFLNIRAARHARIVTQKTMYQSSTSKRQNSWLQMQKTLRCVSIRPKYPNHLYEAGSSDRSRRRANVRLYSSSSTWGAATSERRCVSRSTARPNGDPDVRHGARRRPQAVPRLVPDQRAPRHLRGAPRLRGCRDHRRARDQVRCAHPWQGRHRRPITVMMLTPPFAAARGTLRSSKAGRSPDSCATGPGSCARSCLRAPSLQTVHI